MPSWKYPGTVSHGHSFIYVTTFCTVEKFWDSDDNSQEPPTCGASFGAEMRFGRLPPFPPPPRDCGAWWDLWSITPIPSTCSEAAEAPEPPARSALPRFYGDLW